MEPGSTACAVVLATAPRANGGPGPPGGLFWHPSWTPNSVLGVGRGGETSGPEARTLPPRSVSPSLLGGGAQRWTRGSFPHLDPRWSLPRAGPGRAAPHLLWECFPGLCSHLSICWAVVESGINLCSYLGPSCVSSCVISVINECVCMSVHVPDTVRRCASEVSLVVLEVLEGRQCSKLFHHVL